MKTNNKFTIIAGPCSAESESQVFDIANKLKSSLDLDWFRAGLWKPRTSPNSFEGVGDTGLYWLERIEKELNIKVITEVGNSTHVEKILKHNFKAFWLGARTVANPFSVQEIVSATENKDITVFIKNPIYPDIELWIGAIERFLNAGITNLYAVHRGFFPFEKTKLRNTPNWAIPIELARRFPNLSIICDPSHIAGNVDYIYEIAQQAIDLNMQGLMIETHNNPALALSDKQQQLKPEELILLLNKLTFKLQTSVNNDFQNEIKKHREEIDKLDKQLINILEDRFMLVDKIGELKNQNNVSILQLDRWKEVIENRLMYANKDKISIDFLNQLLQLIHTESIRRQNNLFDNANVNKN